MSLGNTERPSSYVFVSYASVDRERVLSVVDALRSAGIGVWIDQQDIQGGASYGSEIGDGIRGCTALALMCSEASLASRNVRQEIMLAWKYQRPYLPLLLELMKTYNSKVNSETFDTGTLEPAERTASITRAWVLAFADEHVKGSGESPLLHGGEGNDPEVTLKVHPR